MNKNKQTILGILIVVLIAGGAGFYIYSDRFSKSEEGDVSGISIEGEGDYEIEVIPVENQTLPTAPDLDGPVVFNVEMSDEAKAVITSKIATLTSSLKENSNSAGSWIELGTYRKSTGDYEGAKEAWEYAGAILPGNSISFRNLGDLYGYYLNDPQKAEESLLKAIENDTRQIEYYFKTVEFYRDIMKDDAKARQIVEQGIKANPNSEDLKSLLNSLK